MIFTDNNVAALMSISTKSEMRIFQAKIRNNQIKANNSKNILFLYFTYTHPQKIL